MNCRVVFRQGNFLARTDFEGRILPKNAGFRWDADEKLWYTSETAVAVRLREYADESAKQKIDESQIQVSPWSEPLPSPPKGLAYLEHQIEAAIFALSRSRSYLGLDPGLGKTIVAALISKVLHDGFRIVYICPPFLARNTQVEFGKWAPEVSTAIYPTDLWYDENLEMAIIPDSILHRPETIRDIRKFVKGSAAILFVDEAHRFKNDEAKRTISLLGGKLDGEKIRGLIEEFEKLVFMSGTPAPSRPIELYPILSKLAPETIDHANKFQYAKRYCAAFDNGFGWDFSGASNVPELARKVIAPTGPFMLRQKKALLNLPPKLEELFVFSSEMSPKLAKLDARIGEAYADVEDVIKHALAKTLDEDMIASELPVGTYRRLLGQEKVEAACEYIRILMEETDEAVLVFAYHKDVIAGLSKGLAAFSPLEITGATPKDERHEIVEEFQKNPARRLFIANYLAAGIGFTLTKATRVIFTEFSWVPGENDQASDRAHRIGQTEPVLVQYMVYQDSIDKAVLETLLKKKRFLQHV